MRHAHHGVVGGSIAVRVVFTQDFAHHARGFHRLGIGSQPHFLHGKQDAALHGLLAVAHIGQGAAFHHAHGVFEVGAFGVGGEQQDVAVFGGCGVFWHGVAGVSVAKRRNCKASKGFQVACGAVGLAETIAGERVKFCSAPCGRRGRGFYNCTLSASPHEYRLPETGKPVHIGMKRLTHF